MNRISIKIIELGNTKENINKKKLERYKSDFFKIESFEKIGVLPLQPTSGNTLDIVYSKNQITAVLREREFSGLIVGVMNYRFRDNFYMHRINQNTMVISLFGIKEILSPADIDLENFIIRCIYEAVCFYKAWGNSVSDEVYQFVHPDTRGCLFDLSGDRTDIIYNIEKPIICDECKGKLRQRPLPEGFLEKFGNELKRIDKPFLMKIELFIRKYPLLSFIIAIFGSIILNILSSFIEYWLKKNIFH
ncbi:MAG: hypothetical protein WC510_04600 [Candidatus Omnitrophota bacterium]